MYFKILPLKNSLKFCIDVIPESSNTELNSLFISYIGGYENIILIHRGSVLVDVWKVPIKDSDSIDLIHVYNNRIWVGCSDGQIWFDDLCTELNIPYTSYYKRNKKSLEKINIQEFKKNHINDDLFEGAMNDDESKENNRNRNGNKNRIIPLRFHGRLKPGELIKKMVNDGYALLETKLGFSVIQYSIKANNYFCKECCLHNYIDNERVISHIYNPCLLLYEPDTLNDPIHKSMIGNKILSEEFLDLDLNRILLVGDENGVIWCSLLNGYCFKMIDLNEPIQAIHRIEKGILIITSLGTIHVISNVSGIVRVQKGKIHNISGPILDSTWVEQSRTLLFIVRGSKHYLTYSHNSNIDLFAKNISLGSPSDVFIKNVFSSFILMYDSTGIVSMQNLSSINNSNFSYGWLFFDKNPNELIQKLLVDINELAKQQNNINRKIDKVDKSIVLLGNSIQLLSNIANNINLFSFDISIDPLDNAANIYLNVNSTIISVHNQEKESSFWMIWVKTCHVDWNTQYTFPLTFNENNIKITVPLPQYFLNYNILIECGISFKYFENDNDNTSCMTCIPIISKSFNVLDHILEPNQEKIKENKHDYKKINYLPNSNNFILFRTIRNVLKSLNKEAAFMESSSKESKINIAYQNSRPNIPLGSLESNKGSISIEPLISNKILESSNANITVKNNFILLKASTRVTLVELEKAIFNRLLSIFSHNIPLSVQYFASSYSSNLLLTFEDKIDNLLQTLDFEKIIIKENLKDRKEVQELFTSTLNQIDNFENSIGNILLIPI